MGPGPNNLGSGGGVASPGPSILGSGMYGVNQYNINPYAFNNPVGNQAPAWQQGMNNMLGRTAGGTPGMNLGGFNSSMNSLGGVGNQLMSMANGQGPSAATTAGIQTGQQNLNNAMSAAGSMPGGAGNPAAAGYNLENNLSTVGGQTQQNVIQGRTQEEMQALGAAANVFQGMNSNELSLASDRLNAALQNKQINAQQYNAYMQLLQQQVQITMQGNQGLQTLAVGQNTNLNAIESGAYSSAAGHNPMGFIGGAAAGGGSALGSLATIAAA